MQVLERRETANGVCDRQQLVESPPSGVAPVLMTPTKCSGRRNSSITTFLSLSDIGPACERSRRISPKR